MAYNQNNKWGKPKLPRRPMTNHVRPGTSKLIKDEDMSVFLLLNSWSEFARSLHQYNKRNGGFTEKQLAAAVNFRIKVDPLYDPYGEGFEDGVYVDDEYKYIFKVALVTNSNGDDVRSVRKRLIDMPGWSDVKLASKKAALFQGISTGSYRLLGDDELIAIGKKTGICCDCGKVLDNPQSVAAGIGPHCAKIRKSATKKEK